MPGFRRCAGRAVETPGATPRAAARRRPSRPASTMFAAIAEADVGGLDLLAHGREQLEALAIAGRGALGLAEDVERRRRAPAGRGRGGRDRRPGCSASRRSSQHRPLDGVADDPVRLEPRGEPKPALGITARAPTRGQRARCRSPGRRGRSSRRARSRRSPACPRGRRARSGASACSRRSASSSPDASSRSRANSRIVSSIQKRSSPSRVGPAPDEALVEERRERVEVGVADRLGVRERAAAAEDREPGEEPLLVVVEQVVAPGDRGAQRGMALVGVTAALEQVESLPDPLQQLLRA